MTLSTLRSAMQADPLIAIFLAAAGFGIVFIGYHLYELACLYWRGYRARKELHGAVSVGDPGCARMPVVPRSSFARAVDAARSDLEAGVQNHATRQQLQGQTDMGKVDARLHQFAQVRVTAANYHGTTRLTLGPKDGAA